MTSPASARPRPAAIWPIFLVGFFLWYASAYPFHFVLSPAAGAWHQLLTLQTQNLYFGNSLANLLVFMPLGFLIAQRVGAWLTGAAWALIAGMALGLALQVMQIHLPARVPSLWDAIWNTIGTICGAFLAALPWSYWTHRIRARSRFAAALLVLWLAGATFPFAPSLDWAAIEDALAPLLVRPRLEPLAFMEALLGWAAFAFLWRHSVRLPMNRWGPITVLISVLVIQVLVVYRAPQLSDYVGGGLGLLLGLLPVPPRQKIGGLLVLVVAFLVWLGLTPGLLRDTPNAFHWLPLAGFLQGGSLGGPWGALEKLFWYGLLLELLLTAGFRTRTTAIFGMVLLGAIEWAQRWLAGGHVPEITDPLLFAILILVRQGWSGPGLPRGA